MFFHKCTLGFKEDLKAVINHPTDYMVTLSALDDQLGVPFCRHSLCIFFLKWIAQSIKTTSAGRGRPFCHQLCSPARISPQTLKKCTGPCYHVMGSCHMLVPVTMILSNAVAEWELLLGCIFRQLLGSGMLSPPREQGISLSVGSSPLFSSSAVSGCK